MPASINNRPFTELENIELQRVLNQLPARFARVKMAVANVVVLWAASLLATILVWWIISAAARAMLGASIGWNSDYGVAILSVCILLCGSYAGVSTYRWMRGRTDLVPQVRDDLAANRASEEHYEFSEAMRLQEPEHGGLLYFMKSSTGKTFVHYDTASQDLGAQGEEPLDSPFIPRAHLKIVRAPKSRIALSVEFAGPALPVTAPKELLAPPEEWPVPDEYCEVEWSRIESRYVRAPLK
jgi:hypothetical protein